MKAPDSSLHTDVLVIGAGGAGMYAALAAAESADVLIVDKNMIGRGGATVMAQMTVAVALAEQEPDCIEDHIADTLAAGHGLNDPELVEVLCRNAPDRIRELDDWGVGWARSDSDGIHQVHAPGHGVARCCYVDVLNTGPAVAGLLRKRVSRHERIQRLSDLHITALRVADDGHVCGAFGFDVATGATVELVARAVVIATGGLTGLYERNSASRNMMGDGYALAVQAGADLVDMEFVQFFPIGHLAPRLVGMDPIMWDPFRYKLGGRLLNGEKEEFIHTYGGQDDGKYTATRDLATYAICKEVEAERGSPSGGAYLSFEHIGNDALVDAFGPVIDRLAANDIDLNMSPVEVAPIAHYHMGGIRVDAAMATRVPGLFAAGEAIGGTGGSNRLSGNAITEAVVLGEIAGRSAAAFASGSNAPPAADVCSGAIAGADNAPLTTTAPQRLRDLKALMWRDVGPFRNEAGLESALRQIRAWRDDMPAQPPASTFASALVDWHELNVALIVAETVTCTALARRESRGSHQREDFPAMESSLAVNQLVSMENGHVTSRWKNNDVQ